ncbi:conserved hypothetical protein [Hyphomicrobiales bacterium]|jgi:hypothetical protein|nr:conserved hypothetical protein [Hyphomicrobiales bacterium]CAH1702280.1 hypothetical protein BOSEA1005_30152 [Hyphomicrobiales bacterium]CAI0346483.1 conserved hypothetical protein [Hyphomicrobiales bacterium]
MGSLVIWSDPAVRVVAEWTKPAMGARSGTYEVLGGGEVTDGVWHPEKRQSATNRGDALAKAGKLARKLRKDKGIEGDPPPLPADEDAPGPTLSP